MQLTKRQKQWWIGLGFCLFLNCAGAAQLVTGLSPTAEAGVTAGGESMLQAVTPDGRFVLFASTADNLIASTNQNVAAFPRVPHLNLFRRDRQAGTNVLVSAGLTGSGGTGDSVGGDISSNGNWVVFTSTAADLVAGDTNGVTDVFMRSVDTGEILLVSVSTKGRCGNGASRSAVMTPDARYVAFVSAATNLVAGDTNGLEDVFVRDMQLGETRLVSVGAKKSLFVSRSGIPQISADGRYVAFMSSATNLVSTVPTPGEIYVRDLQDGITYCVSSEARQQLLGQLNATNSAVGNFVLSADGQYVAFEGMDLPPTQGWIFRHHLPTGVTDLVQTNAYWDYNAAVPDLPEESHSLAMSADGRRLAFVANTNGTSDANNCVLVWDGPTGNTSLVSGDRDGLVASNAFCILPELDASGRYVAFLCNATNLVTNNITGEYELYCRDLQEARTILVSQGTNGGGAGIGSLCQAHFADGGQIVLFDASTSDLVSADFNQASDVYARSLAGDTMELVSARSSDLPSRSVALAGADYSVSADGRHVAFTSATSSGLPGSANGVRNIYVRNLMANTIGLASVNTNGIEGGNAPSTTPVISGDGRYVAFTSLATDLTPNDNNGRQDVFVHDMETGTTLNLSANLTSTTSAVFLFLQMDTAGRRVLFQEGVQGTLYLFDLQSLAVTNFTVASASPVVLTPDGEFMAYYAGAYLNLWDTTSNLVVWRKMWTSQNLLAISPDGNRIAYGARAGLAASDRRSGTDWTIASAIVGDSSCLRFSADGRYLVYASTNGMVSGDTNKRADVYQFDFNSGLNTWISVNPSLGVANGGSDAPDISPDGRYVVFRSAASNLVSDDTNGLPDIFMWDRSTGNISCLSRQPSGDAADNRSRAAKFVANGRSVLFQSWAQNLTANDFNQTGDLFAFDFLYAQIDSASLPPTIGWTIPAGLDCHVEFSDSLNPPHWQMVTNEILIHDDQAQVTDPTPAVGQRWYRVVGQ